MNNQLKRILDLVKRTGDRMVITDSDGENVYVVMGLSQYEDLIDEGEFENDHFDFDEDFDDIYGEPQEFDHKVTKDAPVSGDIEKQQEDSGFKKTLEANNITEPPKSIFEVMPKAGESANTWDLARMSQKEKEEAQAIHEQISNQKSEEIAHELTGTGQKPKEDEFDEEQFYLEPVE